MKAINLKGPGTWVEEEDEGSSSSSSSSSISTTDTKSTTKSTTTTSTSTKSATTCNNNSSKGAEYESDSNESWKLPIEILEQKIQNEEVLNSSKPHVKNFYKHQNELVDTLGEINKLHNRSTKKRRSSTSSSSSIDSIDALPEANALTASQLKITFPLTLFPFSASFHVSLCVYGTFAINVLLLIIKMFAAISTGSLTVIASALDSFLDLFAGAVLFLTQYLSSRYQSETFSFPGGTSRIEPIGIIIFASTMSVATLQLMLAAVQRLLGGESASEIKLDAISIGIICFTVFAKGSLYIYCSMIKGSESVSALQQDHRNDVVTNSFGLTMAFIAYYKYWWCDPVGAIAIGFWILSVWVRTGSEQVRMLSGYKADDDFLKQITYLVWNHDERIKAIDTVRAFYMAYKYMVEVDIVLDENMKLKEAHDIGESLQDKIEELESVERCWVHLDYETSHAPEHKWQKEVRENNRAEAAAGGGSSGEKDEHLRKRRKREGDIEEV
eukprot:TRINITY_DN3164_c0_g1_i1.p1 TRINITY_DN3164_c0_g1~~TRINITY_DN3164_c0_g1_i1.p1  ORF type:complete len:498 (-),score=110.33 TRINITY_DN3164_c0_g1_i1:9-1502(-)